MNYNEYNTYTNMKDKKKYTHPKDLMTINNLANSRTIDETTSAESKKHNSVSIKMESDQMTHIIDINKNTNESTLSPKLKNTVSIPPLRRSTIEPSVVTTTNPNHVLKQSGGLQSELSEKLSTTTQSQYYGTVKIEANTDGTPTQNFPNNTVNNTQNISMVTNTGIKNMTLPSIGITGLPTIANSRTEAHHDSTTIGVMNISQPAQLQTQQPILLATPTILHLQPPMHMAQPIIAYEQRQPQSGYLTSMSLPIQSTVTQPLQQERVLSNSWKSQNSATILNMNNNEKANLNISQAKTSGTVETNPLDFKISKEAKEDPIQKARRHSVASLEGNSAFCISLVPPHTSATFTGTASATDINTRRSDIIQNEKENYQITQVTSKTTSNNLNPTTQETVDEKEANTNTNKNPVNKNSNMEDNDALDLNKKGSRRLRDSKRAVQNRNAQKAFRQRKEKYVKLLELKAREYDEVMQENILLRKEIFNLKNIIFQMEQQIQMYNDHYMNDLQHQQQQQLQNIQTQQLPRITQLPHQFQPPPPPPAPPL